jgi:ferredoxin
MEMAPGQSDHDDHFDIKWDALPLPVSEQDAETTAPRYEKPRGTLPVEKTPPAEIENPKSVLNELLDFHYYGAHSGAAGPPAEKLIPALLYAYRDLSRVRHEYPICLIDGAGELPVKPLSQIFDDLIDAVAGEGDAGVRLRHHCLQIESAIRARTGGENRGKLSTLGRLSDLWNEHAEELLASKSLDEDKATLLRTDLESAQNALAVDGEVIPCNPDSSKRLLETTLFAFWRDRNANWLDELNDLIRSMDDLLATDRNRSEESRTAERLREASGTKEDELDFGAMAEILGSSELGEPLPGERRARIQTARDTMVEVRPLFADPAGTGEHKPPFHLETVSNSCTAAADTYRERMAIMTQFFKAVRIARLEADNRYKTEKHDPFFEVFEPSLLTREELSHCPPVLLRLDSKFFGKKNKTELFDLLDSDIPVKVLAEINDLSARDVEGHPTVDLGWPARSASVAMAIGHMYVMQTTIARPAYMQEGMMDGLRYDGPALFSVYTGNPEHQALLPPYLVAAAAEESRAFPSFSFHPGRGRDFAEWYDVSRNPRVESAWNRETFQYVSDTDKEQETDLLFTPADFLMTDSRLSAQFWPVPAESWHPDMMPLGDYLATSHEEHEDKIPYITAIDETGEIYRVVVTYRVLAAVSRAAAYWRALQEFGGIDNSHARAALAREKDRLEEEKRLELEEIEKKYSTELDREIGDLSEEIIRRIAGQLIAGNTGGFSMPAAPMPAAGGAPAPSAPAEGAETEAAPPAEAEEDDDEAVSFDDPYIDTPLCTSCNDCMKFNPKLFVYDDNKQAYISDPSTGSFKDLVLAAEKCPVHIIHPGKPKNPNEPDLDDLVARAARFN